MPEFALKEDGFKCGDIKRVRRGFKLVLPVCGVKAILRFEEITKNCAHDDNERWLKWQCFLKQYESDGLLPIERSLPKNIKVRS